MQRFYDVYIVKCRDGSYYTGITNDVVHRVLQHNSGMHPNSYTYNKRPMKLVHVSSFTNVWHAIAWEKRLKRWSRRKKEAWMREDWEKLHSLAECQNVTHHRNLNVFVKYIVNVVRQRFHSSIECVMVRLRSP